MTHSTHSKKMHLANKLTFLISSILFVIFMLLIALSLSTTRKAVLNATYKNLSAISKANGCQIQEFMNICQSTSLNLTASIEENIDTSPPVSSDAEHTETAEIETSVVYPDLKLTHTQKELENYLISTAKNAVAHNDSIIGIGIMFEPYQFTSEREGYALYFTNGDDGKVGVSDVGTYDYYSSQNYYQIAVGKTDTVFIEPYTYLDMWMISGATPIFLDGKMIGVINVDISMDEFNKLNLTEESYPSMDIVVASGSGVVVFDKHTDHIGENMKETVFADSSQAQTILSQFSSTSQFQEEFKSKEQATLTGFFYPLKAGGETWQTITLVSKKDIQSSSIHTILILGIFCILSLVLLIFAISFLLRRALKPIQSITSAADKISHGYLDIDLNIKQSNDEMGSLAEAFHIIATGLHNIIEDENRLLAEMANGNFTVESNAVENYIGDFAPLLDSIRNINISLSNTMRQINESSDQVAMGATQVSTSSQTLSQGASEQASSVEELAATINEISEQITSNANHASSASDRVKQLEYEITTSNQQMELLNSAISEISQSSIEIEKIIKTIEDIAFQTNILALNAAVEAARAGNAGKGFAVVADEVRNLANKSQEAASDTASLIQSSINSVQKGTALANQTALSLLRVVEESKEVTETIDKISAASVQQASSIHQITTGIDQISSVVQNNSATAEESAAASGELSNQAETMKNLVRKFRLKKD